MNSRAWAVTLVPILGLGTLMLLYGDHPWTPLRVVGLVLVIVGFGLLTLARIQLGSSFTVGAEASRLVTRGLYARIRHPVYLFSELGIAGAILYFERPWLLLGLLVLVPIQASRAREEEKVLEDRFGDEYRRYRERTWL